MGDDPYIEPSSSLLRNLLGIDDPETWEHAQAAYTKMRLVQLHEHPVAGRFDLEHLQAVHRHLTQDLVDWAGQLRTVDIAKADKFCPVQHLRNYAGEIFARLAEHKWLSGRSREDFVSGLSELYGDLNALHPFREFSGRAQRAFVSQLALQAGWRVSWRDMSPERNVAASIASFRGDAGRYATCSTSWSSRSPFLPDKLGARDNPRPSPPSVNCSMSRSHPSWASKGQ